MKTKTYFLIILFIFSSKIFAQEIIVKNFEPVAQTQQFPEGPAWDGINSVYSSNCYGNWITKISKNKVDTFIIKPSAPIDFGKTNGLTFDKYGNLFACDYGLGNILKISPRGECDVYASGYEGQKFNRPNDLAFDKSENLFFTDPKSYGKEMLDGRVFMIENKTKKVVLLWDSLAFPNGIAISADGKNIFICESAMSRILKFDLDKKGEISNKKIFVELPGGDPDGIAFDRSGNLFVAHFGGQAVFVISPEGKILQKIPVPGKKPSNIEFGGKDMKDLYITEDETNCVYRTRVDIPGLKLFNHK